MVCIDSCDGNANARVNVGEGAGESEDKGVLSGAGRDVCMGVSRDIDKPCTLRVGDVGALDE